MLVPVPGCWVRDSLGREGRVIQVRDEGGRRLASLQYGLEKQTWVDLTEIRSAFQAGMHVEHVPSATAAISLGSGEVAAIRHVAGYDQVLVQFFESGMSRWLPFQALRRLKPVEHRLRAGDVGRFPDHAERMRMRLLAYALEAWDQSTGALGRLDIDPLPHQTHLAHRVLTSASVNWLIADDVGLGKTVEVGLILHGLALRNQARRVLVVCPAGLVRQWQDEMRYKFDQLYEIYGRDFQVRDAAHWRLHEKVIISLDLAKRQEQRELLRAAGTWDVVIFDEAHRLGRGESGKRTERYRLAEELRPLTPSLLLLTATPHQGKTRPFAALLELVRPDLRAEFRTLEANPDIVTGVVLRNRKTKVTDAAGRPLFNGHQTHRVPIAPGGATRAFVDELTRYVRHGYNVGARAGIRGRAIGFVMTTYRKLASSSIAAICRALELRKGRLQRATRGDHEALDVERMIEEAEASPESLAEQADLFAGAAFFEDEAIQVDRLLRLAEPVRKDDSKLQVFMEELVRPVLDSGRKLLVFTEYRATQIYLEEALKSLLPEHGSVVLINGSMSLDEKLSNIKGFNDNATVLISTEAGGEGLNLHENCHVMVNFDLPWNPSRLVQRIGRLYRYGQKFGVIVINLHAQDSFDNNAINLMLDRVQIIARDLASVSDEFKQALEAEILGELLEQIDFENILERSTEMRMELSEAEIEIALARALDARKIQDELLSFAEGYDAGVQTTTFGLDSRHLQAFVSGMLPRIGATDLRSLHDGRALSFELPPALVGRFPEFGRRRVITLAFDRRLARTRDEMSAVDFDSSFFRELVVGAKAREFDGLYSSLTAATMTASWLGIYLLRWQNERGEPLENEIVGFSTEQGGTAARRLSPKELSALLLAPLASVSRSERNDREEVLAALRFSFETEIRNRGSRSRQPGSTHLIAAAEMRDQT